MVKYKLEDLTNELATTPQLAGRVFEYHAVNNRYGPTAAAAVTVQENARNYAQKVAVATARMRFDAERANAAVNRVLLDAYLPVYSSERNQRNWRNAKTRAAVVSVAGLAGIILAQFMDTKTTKILLEAAGAASLVGSPIALGIAYFKYKA